MKIYVVRHGQTVLNAGGVICGRIDAALSEEGLEQAKRLAAQVRDLKLDAIFSSPLERARTTAELLSEATGVGVTTDGRLIEQNYGRYEGKPRFAADFTYDRMQFPRRLPEGESLLQVAHRVYGFLEEITEKYAGGSVLLVAHFGVCRMVHTYFYDLSNEEFFSFSTGNCELREYDA